MLGKVVSLQLPEHEGRKSLDVKYDREASDSGLIIISTDAQERRTLRTQVLPVEAPAPQNLPCHPFVWLVRIGVFCNRTVILSVMVKFSCVLECLQSWSAIFGHAHEDVSREDRYMNQ